MTPTSVIAMLDGALAANGQAVTLQRMHLVAGAQSVLAAVTVQAQVRGYQPHEMVSGSGITQGDSKVVISPTQIVAANWPGTTGLGDQRVPIKGDRMIIAGRPRTVEAAAPIYLNGALVRIDLQVRG